MELKTSEVYVVVNNSNRGGYGSFDTSEPDEIYTTRKEAQDYADTLNTKPARFGIKSDYIVSSLSDRIYEVKSACREEGAYEQQEVESQSRDY